MKQIKIKFFIFFVFSTLLALTSFASELSSGKELGLTKAYITQDNIVFENGCLLIVDGQNLLRIKTLHQDSDGMYYYYASIYGNCPNGHPYTMDGGCLGDGCLYN